MANMTECSRLRRRVFTLNCPSGERRDVERAKRRSSTKYAVSNTQSEPVIVCSQDNLSKRIDKLKLEHRWNESADHTIDLLESSFGQITPPSSIDDQYSVELLSRSHEKSIQWSTIDIHIHETILSDNVPSSGPPVGIGWQAIEHRQLSIDDFEEQRPARRIQMEMLTPSRSRLDDLMESGLSFRELREACILAAAIRRQRRRSSKDGRLVRRICKFFSRK